MNPTSPPAGWSALIGRRVSGANTDGEPAEGELLGVAEHHVEVLCVDGVVRLVQKRGLRVGPVRHYSSALYVTDAVRADLRAAMQTAPVVRLDSTTGAWTVADGWIETEEPGVYTVPGFATIETGEGPEAMTSPHTFPWRRGMRATRTLPGGAVEEFAVLAVVNCTDGVVRLAWATDTDLEADDDTGGFTRGDACTPVDCGATRGELLEAVREAYGTPTIHVRPSMRGRDVVWTVWNGAPITDRWGNLDIEASTEFAALIAAYNAAPRSTP